MGEPLKEGDTITFTSPSEDITDVDVVDYGNTSPLEHYRADKGQFRIKVREEPIGVALTYKSGKKRYVVITGDQKIRFNRGTKNVIEFSITDLRWWKDKSFNKIMCGFSTGGPGIPLLSFDPPKTAASGTPPPKPSGESQSDKGGW